MKPSLGQTILAAATTLVVGSIIAGVILVGSPAEGRQQQLDSGRIRDLRGIMAAMDSYWDRNERLTTSLDELAEDPRSRVNTVDPGSMRTSMRAAAYPEEDPMTLPTPDEITPVFLYLASDESQGVTGKSFDARDWLKKSN